MANNKDEFHNSMDSQGSYPYPTAPQQPGMPTQPVMMPGQPTMIVGQPMMQPGMMPGQIQPGMMPGTITQPQSPQGKGQTVMIPTSVGGTFTYVVGCTQMPPIPGEVLCVSNTDYKDTKVFERKLRSIPPQSVSVIIAFNNNLKKLSKLSIFTSTLIVSFKSNSLKKLKGIEALSSVMWLDLSFNDLKDIRGLERLFSLVHLDLHSNDISGRMMDTLRAVIALPNLRYLNLWNNDLSSRDIRHLESEARVVNPQLVIDVDRPTAAPGFETPSESD